MGRTRKALRRRKTRKKSKIFNMQNIKLAVEKNGMRIFIGMLGLVFFVWFSINVRSFLYASEYFNVNEIEIIDKYPDKIDYPLARIKNNPNIFEVDLKGIAQNLERENSNIQKAIVKRVLPNKLLVEVLRRTPIAQVEILAENGNRDKHFFYSVNNDSYILANWGIKKKRRFPIIEGAGLQMKDIEVGRCYDKSRIATAVGLLNELANSGFLKKYRVSRVNVSQIRSMSFLINDRLEVKIGDRQWTKKIESLQGVLQNKNINYKKHNYIDLRFKEIVFGKQ